MLRGEREQGWDGHGVVGEKGEGDLGQKEGLESASAGFIGVLALCPLHFPRSFRAFSTAD